MAHYRIPYGRTFQEFSLPGEWRAERLAPANVPAVPDAARAVEEALDAPVGGRRLGDFAGARSAAIAINDKTRPVPHAILLPPLLKRLEAAGLPPHAITLIIATGTHPSMPPDEFGQVVSPEILARYPVVCHNAEDQAGLFYLGRTQRGTPIWMNRRFGQADLRIVVGDIEPHQFMGFSGGVKTAAIGLAGRETVSSNHSLMMDPRAVPGRYDDNPARQDVEEIGRKVGVHFALNAVVNENHDIVSVLAGEPVAVMRQGIALALGVYQVQVAAPFDLIIASPGGHPKDINVYQAQKALAHSSLALAEGGTLILAAACPEGTGSTSYERWMDGMASYEAVFERFRQEGFRVGPHKAFQIARDASRARVVMVSELEPDFVRRLLLNPCGSLQEAVTEALRALRPGARIAVMPAANSTIPLIQAV